MAEKRTETQYMLMLDFVGKSTSSRLADGTTEAQARVLAEEIVGPDIPSFGKPWRVEIWTREVPAEWTKAEELRPT